MTLSVRHLTKAYGGRLVVDDVSLDFPCRQVISLIGPNGAGKSTVFGMIARLIERTAGEVLLDGRDVRDWKSRELARRIAVLTQAASSTLRITVRELVAFGRFPHSGPRLGPEDRRIVDEAIEWMELAPLADRFLDEISGGQRQRAFIAMVLAQDTEYVFLDEPTNNLDVYHATRMMKVVRRLCDEWGKTVVLVLHEINLAAYYSDRIFAFKEGRVAAQGGAREVFTQENLKALYGVDFRVVEIDGRPMTLCH